MTAAERAYLKHEIDHAIRARLSRVEKRCKGCGMPMDDWTPGCSTCSDRHREWRNRGDPRYDPILYLRMRAEWYVKFNLESARNQKGAKCSR